MSPPANHSAHKSVELQSQRRGIGESWDPPSVQRTLRRCIRNGCASCGAYADDRWEWQSYHELSAYLCNCLIVVHHILLAIHFAGHQMRVGVTMVATRSRMLLHAMERAVARRKMRAVLGL